MRKAVIDCSLSRICDQNVRKVGNFCGLFWQVSDDYLEVNVTVPANFSELEYTLFHSPTFETVVERQAEILLVDDHFFAIFVSSVRDVLPFPIKNKIHKGAKLKDPRVRSQRTTMTMSQDEKEHRMSVTGTSGIASLVTLMETYQSIPGVQEHGCGLLGALANDNKDHKFSIARVGGIEAIIHAMQSHKKEAAVQACGCDALARLAFRHNENQVAIAAGEGISAILAAMQLHSNNADVQTNGCGALLNLAANLENKKAITRGFGISVIEDAMRQHPAVDKMQEFGHAAVSFLRR